MHKDLTWVFLKTIIISGCAYNELAAELATVSVMFHERELSYLMLNWA